jgi:hypothetical protein
MARARTETAKRFVSAERVEQLGRFALIFLVARGGGDADDTLQQRLDGIGRVSRSRHDRRSHRVRAVPLGFIIFFGDIGENELIAVARYGAHESRLARVVSEDAPDGSDRLAERAVGHDDVGPDAIEDVAAVNGFAAPFDEKHEQIEIARDERLRAAAAKQHAAARG